jgi:hypothetical protein
MSVRIPLDKSSMVGFIPAAAWRRFIRPLLETLRLMSAARSLSLFFAAGAIGGLVSSLAVWLFGELIH